MWSDRMVKKGNIHNFCLTMCYVLGKIEDSNNKTHFPTVMNQRISGLPWLWELLSSHYLWLYHAWLMSWIRSERASVAEEAVLRLSIEQGCMFNEDNCRVSVRDTKVATMNQKLWAFMSILLWHVMPIWTWCTVARFWVLFQLWH